MVAARQRDRSRAERIERVFLETLQERGFDGTALAEVARRADVTPALVHYHFRDKMDLLRRALRGQRTRTQVLLRDLWGLRLPPRTHVLTMVDLFLQLASQRANLAVWVASIAASQSAHSIRYDLWSALQGDLKVFGHALRQLPAPERLERVEGSLLLLLSGAQALLATAPNPLSTTVLAAEVRRAAAVVLDGAACPRASPEQPVRVVLDGCGGWVRA